MKTFVSTLAAFVMLLSCLMAPAALADDKISVVTTIFPIYDWVRQVAGDNLSNIDLTMLLDNGVDLHSYQPTAQDIMKVSNADLFIYVGGESDEWVEDVLEAAPNADIRAINLVEAMGEDIKMEEMVEGMEHAEEEDEEEADEHVWLSLHNAEKLVKVIADVLAEIDGEHADTYLNNAKEYEKKLSALDERYKETISSAAFDTLLFADRFPFRYLTDDYDLKYYAAFSGCSAESEASFDTVAFLIGKLNELALPAVIRLEDGRINIADTIIRDSATKDQRIVILHSMQQITGEDVRTGISYLSVMEDNLNALRKALNP